MNPGTEAVKRFDRQRQKDRDEQAQLREVKAREMHSDKWSPEKDEALQRQLKAEFLERQARRAA